MNARIFAAITALLAVTACDVNSIETECIADGSCWSKGTTWTAWAQDTGPDMIVDMLSLGLLAPSPAVAGDECWELVGTDGHLCVAHLNGATLVGRPIGELPLTTPVTPCSGYVGAWDYTRTAYGTCFGVIDDVAFELRWGL